jgi:hypothetical protein
MLTSAFSRRSNLFLCSLFLSLLIFSRLQEQRERERERERERCLFSLEEEGEESEGAALL